MNAAHALHASWHPQTKEERDAVFCELDAILESPHFCNSKRYPALLRFIVENALAGKADLLKERTLGIEVFERPANYDTNADTVVRYTAGEVRKRLLLYYSELNHPPLIRISLPAGSYVPEFSQMPAEAVVHAASSTETEAALQGGAATHEATWHSPQISHGEMPSAAAVPPAQSTSIKHRRLLWLALVAVLVLVTAASIWWRYRADQPQGLVEDFWSPVLHGQRTLMICTGGSVFSNTRYSGVETANRDIDYPFVSWQSVSAAVQISGALSHTGVTTQLLSAPSVQLTDLREHSVTLLGAYNNQWTMHLQQPLRYYFQPGVDEVILDRTRPEVQWKRDQSLPYSSADDYAVIARFRDATTDSWVVVLAGLGRNGTEAAAQFVTSPHYLAQLRDRLGSDFSNRNIEAVLKINVIQGKTGAPSILAAYAW